MSVVLIIISILITVLFFWCIFISYALGIFILFALEKAVLVENVQLYFVRGMHISLVQLFKIIVILVA